MKCSYCGKEFNKGWISFVGTAQCNRLICRIKSGHLIDFTFKIKYKNIYKKIIKKLGLS